MVTNCNSFLLEYILWLGGVIYEGHIVPIDIYNAIYGNTHHHEFVPQASMHINTYLNCDNVITKDFSLYLSMMLEISVNKVFDDVDSENTLGASGVFVPCMVVVYKYVYI